MARLISIPAAAATLLLSLGPVLADDADDCFQSDDLDLAIIACTALIDSDELMESSASHALVLRGMAYEDIGDRARGIEDYHEAIRRDSENAEAHNSLAWALYLDGRPAEALPFVQTAISLLLIDAAVLDTHAHILAAMGRFDEAVETFELAMQIGGVDQVLMYQRALAEHGTYSGLAHGFYDPATRVALNACLREGCRLLE